jgi:pimeloyl-ACP methyl ester carboxylesterase
VANTISLKANLVSQALASTERNTEMNASAAAPQPAVRYLDRGTGRVAYDVQGPDDAPLVVIAPGMGDLRQVFRFNIEPLVAAGYRVATMDLRGQGDSDTTFDRFEDFAAASDIIALVEHLGGPAVLYANSMSSAASVVVAGQRPDLVAGLVLTGAFIRDQPTSKAMDLLMRAALLRPWGPTAWMSYYAGLYKTRKPADFAEYKSALRASMKRPGHWKAFQTLVSQLTHAEVEPYADQVKAPVLVVMGTKDPDFKDPTAEAKFVAERLGGEALLVEGAGHYPMAEFPEVVNPQVVEFARAVFGA